MYKARVKVNVTSFGTGTAFGDVPKINAYLSDCLDISAAPRPDGLPVFVLDPPPPPSARDPEQHLHIHVPLAYKNGVQIIYQLPVPVPPRPPAPAPDTWVILGIAFESQDTNDREVGQSEFPLVSLNRDSNASEMSVIDMCDQGPGRKQSFTYGIVLQRVGDGKIGVFDPTIENEPPNPSLD